MTFQGALPLVFLPGFLWYKNPTLLHDYIGKLRKPDFPTNSEKLLENDLQRAHWHLFVAGGRIADQKEALSSIANGLLNQPRMQ